MSSALARSLLLAYLLLRLAQQLVETLLAIQNQRYAIDPLRLAGAARALGIADDEMQKAVVYSADRYRFGLVSGWIEVGATLALVAAGGLGLVESWARAGAARVGLGALATGLAFFALLGLASGLLALPFDLYATFRIEQKHGFNRQTLRGFLLDRVKGLALGIAFGGPLLATLLWVMARLGPLWWLWAWALVAGFNLLAAWIYPTLLAPIFNRFTPLAPGELQEEIQTLARRVGFRSRGIFVMDASRRTAHGNAYFTGLFGQKRIVLFDTLLETTAPREVVAVLAHELGHFKLRHVRWAIVRSVATSGALFFLLHLLLPLEPFYSAFSLQRTPYGALAAFGLWFGLVSFLLQPLENALSRRHEFAADRFALGAGVLPAELAGALLKLRERSRLLPLAHPLYSRVYYSHPPLVERLRAMGALPEPHDRAPRRAS
jgi:STE24 endopeptidase